eukprot:TRINITY_DN2003_c0_g1_i2.p1 TRINITY_DN2003_c0_g1~~TRINITY_DN2003_c0_g1_i2.p1  ORF type:complete len:404 (+),score=96.30 TRINITY_DN2003_c0_g1_i2:245-1456(+)
MPKRQSRKQKQSREMGKSSAEFLDLTEEERILLALEMSKTESKGPAQEEYPQNYLQPEASDSELEAILQLSLNPEEQINQEHREFLAILTREEEEASRACQGGIHLQSLSSTSSSSCESESKSSCSSTTTTKSKKTDASGNKGLHLEELDEEEQLLIALRRSAKENQFQESCLETLEEPRSNKGKENHLLPYKRIISKRRPPVSSSGGSDLSSSPPSQLPILRSEVASSSIPRIVVSETGGYSPFRPIVIDGCNLAWAHGDHKRFSPRGLALAYKRFLSMGSREIVIFVRPNSSTDAPMNEEEEKIMERLRELKVLHEIPKNRTTAGFHVSHYDDLMIVDYAVRVKGIVVSNDHFEDIIDHSKEFKDQIRYRLLSFTWVGDVLLFPQDPLGKGGPTLKNFLKR